MIKKIHASNSVIWFDDQLLDHPPESVFDIEYWQGQESVIGSATGEVQHGLSILGNYLQHFDTIAVAVYLAS